MPYVQRTNGTVTGVFVQLQPGIAEEHLADDHAEVIAFAAPKVEAISDRQFFQMLALSSVITMQEALAAVKTGEIPAAIQVMVDAIEDETERFSAEMILSGATIFRRNHPLTTQIGLAQGMTSQQIDDFFLAASQL